MSKKNNKLNGKEKAVYSKMIAQKLITLGVKDEVAPSGRKYHKRFVDEAGKVVFEVITQALSNPHRNMVKKLREMDRNVIESFLNMKAPEEAPQEVLSEQAPAPAPEQVK